MHHGTPGPSAVCGLLAESGASHAAPAARIGRSETFGAMPGGRGDRLAVFLCRRRVFAHAAGFLPRGHLVECRRRKMTRAGRNQEAKGGLELIEEATHLLRAVPFSAFAGYYLGTVPFVLGALYFWADMSRSPFADQHLAGAALGLALLFLWMKLWQALFAGELRVVLAGGAKPPVSFARLARLISTQSALQATGLFLLPFALI